jgi:ribosomal protein L7Ae-like RNA K-turn-binding protein
VFYCYHSDELGKAIGKRQRKVIGITDKGLAKEIQRRIKLLTGVGDIDEITRV